MGVHSSQQERAEADSGFRYPDPSPCENSNGSPSIQSNLDRISGETNVSGPIQDRYWVFAQLLPDAPAIFLLTGNAGSDENWALERLELAAVKVARSVLRGRGTGNSSLLLDPPEGGRFGGVVEMVIPLQLVPY